jgi:hypothetical protein
MGQQVNFHTIKTWDNKTQFVGEGIIITIDHFAYNNGMHVIANPEAARAHFICHGKGYVFRNIDGIPTVEEWYANELVPKFKMMNLLFSPGP